MLAFAEEMGGVLLSSVEATRAGRFRRWPNRPWSWSDGDWAGASVSKSDCSTGSERRAHAFAAHSFVRVWCVRRVHWEERVLGAMSDLSAAQHAIPIISRMGRSLFRSSSLRVEQVKHP